MQLKVLNEEGVSRIDKSARKILEVTGILVPQEDALDLFSRAGAKVDFQSGKVKIPGKLLDECLGQAGRSFTIYGRDITKKADFGRGKRNYNSSSGQALWIDTNYERRYPCLDDVITATKLGDVLPELNVVGAMADPQEIDISFRCVQVAAQQIKTTTKPILFWFYNRATARFIVELFSALRGSSEDAKRYPVSYPLFEPISPLRFPKDGIELLFEISKINLPVAIGPMVQAGLTGPVTLAGTLVLQTAEVLAGICITQLINPGTPICFGGICHAFDMRNTQIIFGGPEQALMSAASVEIAHYYGFPAYTNSGLTDSKCPDAQAGLEIAATMLSAAFAGSDIFGHLGICGADQAASLETLLLQHEVISYIEHIMKGINTEYENICVELINDTGPGGSFIESMHTAEHYKEELWFPNLLNRDSWSAWKDKGRLSLQDTLPGCLQELLDSYEQKPLPKETLNDMNQIVDEAAKY